MKNIKTYELFSGSRITNSLKNDIKAGINKWNNLMRAIVSNNFSWFEKELNKNNLEYIDIKGNTALLIAVSEGRLTMFKELVKRGANIFHKNVDGDDFYDIADKRYKFINLIRDYIEKEYPEFIAAKKYNL